MLWVWSFDGAYGNEYNENSSASIGRVIGFANRRLRLALLNMAGPSGPDQELNYGLLDLGALACTTRAPKFALCPIRAHCETGRNHNL